MRRPSQTRSVSRRGGFTLLELSVGLIASSILLLGLTGSLFLATQANRLDLGPFRNSSAGAFALDEVTRELSYATKVRAVTPGRSVEVEVPDRTGDGAADVVKYEWSGTAGAPLTRRFNGGPASNVAAALQAFDLQTTSRTVTEQMIGNITNTSGPALWYEKSSSTLLEGSVSISSGDGFGLDFIPKLPEGATNWTLIGVDVRCQAVGTASSVIKARVWTADGNRKPATMLAEETVNEWDLPSPYDWHTVIFSPAPTLSVSQRACITFQHSSGSNTAMQIREDALAVLPPFLRLSTGNGGEFTELTRTRWEAWLTSIAPTRHRLASRHRPGRTQWRE
jgi:prepilin-type N-terminal cleavage/methylation domain-containing protein